MDRQEVASVTEAEDISASMAELAKIIDASPKTDDAFESLHQLSILQIRQKDIKSSKVSTAALLREFPNHPETAAVIHDIANHYFWDAGDFTESRALYQRVIDERPDGPDTLGAYQGVACSSIALGDFAAAEAATDKILTDYHDHKDVAGALTGIAGRYFWNAGDYSKSRILYQRVITDWPEAPDIIKAYQGLACSSLSLSDRATAETATNKIITDYSNHPDFPDVLTGIARGYYWDARDYSRSREFYQRLIKDFPDHPNAMKAYYGNACCSISLGDLSTAETAVDTLLADYSNHPDFPDALMGIARAYFWDTKESSKSHALYEHIITKYPGHPDIVKAYEGLARTSVALGDFATAEEVTNTLLTDYSGYEDLPGILTRIAYSYLWDAQDYSMSRILFQRVITDWPDCSDVADAYQGMADIAVETVHAGDPDSAMTLVDDVFKPDLEGSKEQLLETMTRARIRVHSGDNAVAEAMVDDSINRFKNVPDVLSAQLFGYGEEYYLRAEKALKDNDIEAANADYKKATEVWGKHMTQLSDSNHQCLAYYYSGVAYQKLDQAENAVQCYDRIVHEWPDYEKAWYAQYMIAKYYEKQVEQGTVAPDVVRDAYQLILDRYPDCSAAKIATNKLAAF